MAATTTDITLEQYRAAVQAEGLRLEAETCMHCCGTGYYGHYGVCFRCGGAKRLYTKRGLAAKQYLTNLRSRKVAELAPGDKVFYRGFTAGSYTQPSKWCKVLQVRPGTQADGGALVDGQVVPPALVLETDGCNFHTGPDQVFEVALTRARQLETLRAAVAFQATLTKAGKPRAGATS